MTSIHPPLLLESFLEALGAQTTFRDAVIGDMAEEFAFRAHRDGRLAALGWYVLQSARTSPHLLRNWSRQPGSVGQVARAVGISYLIASVVLIVAVLSALALLNATGVSKDFVERAFGNLQPGVVAGMLLLQSISPLCGGFLAARLDRRAPLVSVFALAVIWSVAFLVSSAFIPVADIPEWWRVATFGIVLVGTSVGGVLGVWSTSAARARNAQ